MERLLAIGLIIGIPFILACILYAICHGPFICMNYEKKDYQMFKPLLISTIKYMLNENKKPG